MHNTRESLARSAANPQSISPVAQRMLEALERLERRFDEFARVYLNGKFPHGRPTDRWRR